MCSSPLSRAALPLLLAACAWIPRPATLDGGPDGGVDSADTGAPNPDDDTDDTDDTGTVAPGPRVGAVTVLGSVAAEVAQGRAATLVVEGEGLGDVTSVLVDGALACTIGPRGATEVQCDLEIPHGHPLDGPLGLPRAVDVRARVSTEPLPGGTGALTITPITVDPAASTDGRGTSAEPYRTLALALADGVEGGDFVALAKGDYRDDAGETWPLAWSGDATLRGEAGTRFVATDDSLDFLAGWEGPTDGAPSRIRSVELVGFQEAIDVQSGLLELVDVTIRDTVSAGIRVRGDGAVELDNDTGTTSVLDGEGYGIVVEGTGSLVADGAVVRGHREAGVYVTGGTVTWTFGELASNGQRPDIDLELANLYVSGGTVTLTGDKTTPVQVIDSSQHNVSLAGGEVTLDHVTLHNAQFDGIRVGGTADVTVLDSTISLNGDVGISVSTSATGTLRVRDTTLSEQRGSGLFTEGCADHDLGRLGDPGGNTFEDNVRVSYDSQEAQLWVSLPGGCYETVDSVGNTFVQGASSRMLAHADELHLRAGGGHAGRGGGAGLGHRWLHDDPLQRVRGV